MSEKNLKEWIRGLEDEVRVFSRKELNIFLSESKKSTHKFIRGQARICEKYLAELASDEISVDEFKSDIQDMIELSKLQATKEKVRAKAKIQAFTDDLVRIILNGLLKILL
jgi:hypothetical protein